MQGEDSVEHEADSGEAASQAMPEPNEPGLVEPDADPDGEPLDDSDLDIISDWPADTLPPEVPPEPQWASGGELGYWVPGGELRYAKPQNKLLPGQRRPSTVSPLVGTITMWMGIGSAVSLVASAVVGWMAQTAGAQAWMEPLAGLLALSGFANMLGAIVLGTIGRQSGTGHRHATIGRRIGCAIPMVLLGFAIVAAFFDGAGDGFAAVALFLFALIVGNLILLIIDAILGTN